MDAQLQTLVLQMLRQTADGLAAAIRDPEGAIETGSETAARFEARMELSMMRLQRITDILAFQGAASPDQLTDRCWNDQPDEREYQQQLRTSTRGRAELE